MQERRARGERKRERARKKQDKLIGSARDRASEREREKEGKRQRFLPKSKKLKKNQIKFDGFCMSHVHLNVVRVQRPHTMLLETKISTSVLGIPKLKSTKDAMFQIC